MLRELIGFARVAITPASSSALSSGSLTSLRITCGCNDALTDDLDALQPGEEVCCRGGEGLRIFARGGGVHLPYRGRVVEVCLRPGAGLPRASVVGIGLRVAIGFAGGLLMHAAAVRWGDLAALVLGASGLGKSTFAAATIRSGGRVLSDDLVLACSAGDPPRPVRLLPMRRDALITDDAAAILPPRLRVRLERSKAPGEPKSWLRREGADSCFASAGELGCTLVLQGGARIRHSRVEPISQAAGLAAVIAANPLLSDGFPATADALMRTARHVVGAGPVLALSLGSDLLSDPVAEIGHVRGLLRQAVEQHRRDTGP